jgi:PAS domain S-box-containing protein
VTVPLRLLIIEDSEDDALLIVRELKRAGYEPGWQRVDSAAAVQAALEHGPWDIVICDFSMPHFNGTDALRLFRERDQDTPFIFVSGTIGEEVAVEAMRSGAQDYVMKSSLRRLAPVIDRERSDAAARRERRATEAVNAQLAAILEATTDFVGTADTDGQLRYVNRAGRRILGIGPSEDVGRLTIADLFLERERARLLGETIPTTLRDGVWRGESVFRARDGREIPVSIVGLAHRGMANTAPYLSMIVRDLSAYKKLEEQYLHAQKMEAVGRLAGGVAHDFNNLLTVINSYSAFLLEDLESQDPRRRDVEEIAKAGVSAAYLTRQLLAFSRQQVIQPQVLDVNDVVANAESLLKRMIGEDVVLATTLAPQLGRVRVDPGQFEQVIMNLAVNARDAMPGGGRLTIETGNAEMDEAYVQTHAFGRPGRYVTLAVSDSGVGMDETTKAHIFEPFFTTKEVGKGTGLGLATVYGIVKQGGGFISVYSEVGRGTTFKIYLPRTDEPVEHLDTATPTSSLRGTETLLVVDDAPAVRMAVRGVLERHGYTILEAPTGEAALQLAAKHRGALDLLITDVVMPGMSGRDVARSLSTERPGLKVLYMSGYTDDTIVRHGMLEPGVRFVQKPFAPDALAQLVRQVLDAPP